MTIPLWCLLAAVILPYVWQVPVVAARRRQFEKLDNNNPRQQVAQLQGVGARAYAAQQNAFEALAVFVPAVLVAHVTHADPSQSAALALVWVVCRVLHGVLYLADVAAVRSLAFGFAFLAAIGQFVIAAMASGATP
ncbi:MAPEG family protein [Chondromyces crocatus]|uniref:Membrane protein n=1 Tax=Chondromyces crocatus TaxID=52 RepID=A0A0K1E9S7_CHOCO|nr:MAPEG family protein [Chondromyces crocatus]AKT37442.1 membrane protein [Chondromyces crocatus]